MGRSQKSGDRSRNIKRAAIGLAFVTVAFAQSQIVTGGYSVSYPGIVAAPGQVITLFVQGVNVPDAAAQSFPLPTALSGLSVAVKVVCCNPSNYATALPILKVHFEDFCTGRTFFPCPFTQVTVQIPTEPLCVRGPLNDCYFPGAMTLTVQVPGVQTGQSFPVTIQPTNPHFLNTCDTVLFGSGICTWEVTHADGSPLTEANFAKPGETIVLYAVGLGFPDPSVPTGMPAKSPVYSLPTDSYLLTVSFEEDVPGSSPAPPASYLPAGKWFQPEFIGIVPGYVGLYQINFTVPQPPSQAHHCAGPNFADTNTRISFPSSNSYVDVCVFVP